MFQDIDVDVDGVYERRPRPLCPPHLITLRFNYMLREYTENLKTTLELCDACVLGQFVGGAIQITVVVGKIVKKTLKFNK